NSRQVTGSGYATQYVRSIACSESAAASRTRTRSATWMRLTSRSQEPTVSATPRRTSRKSLSTPRSRGPYTDVGRMIVAGTRAARRAGTLDADDLVATRDERLDQMAADEPRSTRDHRAHAGLPDVAPAEQSRTQGSRRGQGRADAGPTRDTAATTASGRSSWTKCPAPATVSTVNARSESASSTSSAGRGPPPWGTPPRTSSTG